MLITLTIILILLSIVAHEFGHAIAMRRYNIPIKEMGLGFPVWKLPYLSFRLSNGTPFKIHLFILGGYVKPEDDAEEKMETLGFKQEVSIHAAGIYMNILFYYCIVFMLKIIDICQGKIDMRAFGFFAWIAIMLTAGIILYFSGRKKAVLPKNTFREYFLLSIGLIAFAFLIYGMYKMPIRDAVGGPVSIIKEIKQYALSIRQSFIFAGFISLNLAFINLLPCYPLDGGNILISFLKKKWKVGKRYVAISRTATGLFFLSLIIIALSNDIATLL